MELVPQHAIHLQSYAVKGQGPNRCSVSLPQHLLPLGNAWHCQLSWNWCHGYSMLLPSLNLHCSDLEMSHDTIKTELWWKAFRKARGLTSAVTCVTVPAWSVRIATGQWAQTLRPSPAAAQKSTVKCQALRVGVGKIKQSCKVWTDSTLEPKWRNKTLLLWYCFVMSLWLPVLFWPFPFAEMISIRKTVTVSAS